ncbi:YkvI family membrane protein [Luteimonas sp. SDU101]|uniref:YkvI family membrane protein n=1 Tax=unclassified Luteimonas TaxID=2629088 RepID=UPI003EBD1065
MRPAATWFQRFLLPGFVFQAAVIAGGYATGRELVEFFLPAGPWGGLLGMAVSMLVWSVVLMASFELARRARAYDYRAFFRVLLGRGWWLFEIGYVALMLVILAVMGAAAGEIAHSLFGLPRLAGSLAMIVATGALLTVGAAGIERFLVASVGYLYLVYAVFVVWCVIAFGDRIGEAFATGPVDGGWLGAGVTYAGYNVATIPAVLFCVRHFGRSRDALVAGALAGPLGMLPGVLFYVAMMGWHLEIADQALPSAFLLARLQAPWFEWAFQLAVMLTLVDTGVALLHAINERVAAAFRERERAMPRALRPGIAVGTMLLAVYAATAVGLVDLIARGYGTLTWYFLAIYVLPLMTWGLWRLWRGAPRVAVTNTAAAGPAP